MKGRTSRSSVESESVDSGTLKVDRRLCKGSERGTDPVRVVNLRRTRKKETERETLCWWRSQGECEIDTQELFEEGGDESDLDNRVASVGDNA